MYFCDMKKRTSIFGHVLATGVFLLYFAGLAAAQSDAEQAVRKLERAWLDAYEMHDAKAMDEIVADEFFIIFPDGTKQTKPELMAQIRRASENPTTRKLKFRTEDVEAKVDANTVVLSGSVITETVVDGQVTSKQKSLYTDTYVRRNGKWRVIESHLSDPKSSVKR